MLIAALRYATIVHSTSTVRYRTRGNVVLAVAAIWALMLGGWAVRPWWVACGGGGTRR